MLWYIPVLPIWSGHRTNPITVCGEHLAEQDRIFNQYTQQSRGLWVLCPGRLQISPSAQRTGDRKRDDSGEGGTRTCRGSGMGRQRNE